MGNIGTGFLSIWRNVAYLRFFAVFHNSEDVFDDIGGEENLDDTNTSTSQSQCTTQRSVPRDIDVGFTLNPDTFKQQVAYQFLQWQTNNSPTTIT